jgi:demethylmenaquinone methyltransferase/2-methoxy-6-polyprenyl-1,4-benzoquinol methylase
MMEDDVLQTQIAYYRARAEEYDATSYGAMGADGTTDLLPHPELGGAWAALAALGPFEHILELACGTGVWTHLLRRVGRNLTALDAAPEMLALNRQRVGDPAVRYECVDLFAWEPDAAYDLVFFAFWLSHVPPERLDGFLDAVARAVRPGGRVFMIDEPISTPNKPPLPRDGTHETRPLLDGREFTIVKVYYDPAVLGEKLAARGFTQITPGVGESFFFLHGTRR